MNRFLQHTVIIAAAICCCTALRAKDEDPSSLIVPRPQSIAAAKKSPVPMKNHFKVSGSPVNFDSSFDERSRNAIAGFASQLTMVTGKTSSFASPIGLAKSAQNGIVKGIVFYRDPSLADEEYSIVISDNSLIVAANGYNSVLYSIQTIKQLLPAAVYGHRDASGEDWRLPCMTIHDKPLFGYRGLMLDCSRHFFSTDDIRKMLDVMAMFKLNRFHWHLTDDQGWRVESVRYPLLTQVGAYRDGTMVEGSSDGIRYGGYYTKDQIRDIVAYAGSLGIEVIPEIGLPGHMQAALAAYPQLGCSGGPYEVKTDWGISSQVLCGGSAATMEFLKGVLEELTELFPYRYIHIGGGECRNDEWEKCPVCQAKIAELGLKDDEASTKEQKLQTWLAGEVQSFLKDKGKEVITWDEICDGGTTDGTVMMTCKSTDKALEVALAGSKQVILTQSLELLSHDKSTRLEKAYSSGLPQEVDPKYIPRILGIQANMWSEYVVNGKDIECMLLPGMLVLSEMQWNGGEGRNFETFSKNLVDHEFKVLDEAGYIYNR